MKFLEDKTKTTFIFWRSSRRHKYDPENCEDLQLSSAYVLFTLCTLNPVSERSKESHPTVTV